MLHRIKKLAGDYYDDVRKMRRYFHQNPELSFQEQATSAYIAGKLKEYGISYNKGIAKTGLIGRIEGKNPENRIIGLRTDMDALPITENNNLPYKSSNKGVMHACGHDIHMASLLGAARILNEIKNELKGTVLLVFQPGEELIPGGAKLMIKEGAFKDTKPEIMLALHVQPDIPTGHVGFREGKYMASSDEIYLTVKGRGGHAALPHQVTDSVLTAAHIIIALQEIVNQNTPVSIPTVLSFGKVIANGATNVIPNEVRLEGTFRTTDETWRKKCHKRMETIIRSTAESYGTHCETEIRKGYPVLFNDPGITRETRNFANQFLGEGNIKELDIRMTSEDFAYFSQEFPACFFRLGVGDSTIKHPAGLHTPAFLPNEKALETGSGLMAWLAWSFLRM